MSYHVADSDALTAVERELVDEISAEEPWALLEEFATLEWISGTADEEAAAEYVTDRLETHGVAYDRYDPELYISQPPTPTLRR